MKQVILDTNYYIRLLLNDIPEQSRKVELLLLSAQRGEMVIVLPAIVIFEIYFVLEKQYELPKSEILEKLKTIISTEYIHIDEKEVFWEALRVCEKSTLSLPDCYLYGLSRVKEIPLHTFDKKLEKLK